MNNRFIDIHTHKYTDSSIVEIVNIETSQKISYNFSVGIHPWKINTRDINKQLEFLKFNLVDEKCLAIGECGIDKNIDIDYKIQKSIFIQQLELNKKYHKPVIVHCVKAFQEIILIKKAYSYPFIIHGFNKKKELALQLIKEGFYLSFGKALIKKLSLQEVFKALPLNYLFLETDNSSVSIKKVYEKAAELKEISIDELLLILENNFKKIFK